MVSNLKLGENWKIREDEVSGDFVLEDRINTTDLFTLPTGAGNNLELGSDLDLAGNVLTDSSQSYVDLSDGNNLRLSTGQSIEDGSGTKRLNIISDGVTDINDGNGNPAVRASKAGTELKARNGRPVEIQDDEGDFDAVRYNTSATAPGTLELTNANITTAGHGTHYTTQAGTAGGYRFDAQTDGSDAILFNNPSGEILGQDEAGNQTTLT
jgi:hypothetical protein